MNHILSPTQYQRALLEQPIEQRLFLEGPAGAGKTTAALLRMEQILASGVPGSQLMVLAPQRTLLAAYDRALRQPESLPGGVPTLLTVGGLAQRMVEPVLAAGRPIQPVLPAPTTRQSS